MLTGRSCQGVQGSTVLRELPHDDDHRHDKEEMEEAVERRGRAHPEKPSDHADHWSTAWAAPFPVLGGQQGRRLGGGAAPAPWAPVPPFVA